MATKYTSSEQCISAEDARLITDALDAQIKDKTKKGGWTEDIRSMKIAKEAIDFVLDRASFQHDDICFYVNIGARNINKIDQEFEKL